MSIHICNATSEVARPRHGISVLECLIRLGRLVRSVKTSTDIKPQDFHFAKASRKRWDVLPCYSQDRIAREVDHVHQFDKKSEVVLWSDVVASLVRPADQQSISMQTNVDR
jgi:hypothetical protein